MIPTKGVQKFDLKRKVQHRKYKSWNTLLYDMDIVK